MLDPIVVFDEILIFDYGFHLSDVLFSSLLELVMKVALEVLDVLRAVLLVQKVVHKLLHFLLEWAILTQIILGESFFFSEDRWHLLILEVYLGFLIMIL